MGQDGAKRREGRGAASALVGVLVGTVLTGAVSYAIADAQIAASRSENLAAVSASVLSQTRAGRLEAYEAFAAASDRHVDAIQSRNERDIRGGAAELRRRQRVVEFRGSDVARAHVASLLNRSADLTNRALNDPDGTAETTRITRLVARQQDGVQRLADIGRVEDQEASVLVVESAGAE